MDIKDLIQFLRDKGVTEDHIKKISDEKIDCSVLLLMDDDQLNMYIPTYGDRLAAKEFCRNSGIHGASKGKSKLSIKDRLRKTVRQLAKSTDYKKSTGSKKEVKESSDESDSLEDKYSRATRGRGKVPKNTRTIDIGYYHYMKDINYYKQIRKDKAGGPKVIEPAKCATLKEVKNTVTNLYFPNGNSIRGPVSNFNVKLTDVNFTDVNEYETVEAYYDRGEMRTLRFNFITTNKLDDDSEDSDDLPIGLTESKKKGKSQNSTPVKKCDTNDTQDCTATETQSQDFMSTMYWPTSQVTALWI